ncbi:MAG TPA: BamA/TamA family outer membrane protein [Spirochaetia bacterium]|nr:BamA/TamA family outer membrane protein [Spirochaetia bacterium]
MIQVRAARRRAGALLRAAALLGMLVGVPASVWPQYFDRNKIQYGAIDFSVLTTDHFLIYHYPRGTEAVMDAARMLESWYSRHADTLGFGIKGRQKVILYNSFIDFEQTNVIPGLISQGEGGVTESLARRIVLPLTGTEVENMHVLGHELVHAFQFERMTEGIAGMSSPLPLWFMEGQAEYLSLGPDDPLTSMWMRDALASADVPSIGDIAGKPSKYFPYRFGDAVWDWIGRGWGQEGVQAFFSDAVSHGIADAVVSALGMKDMDDFTTRWDRILTDHYGPELDGRTLPRDVGRTLPGLASGLNLSPVISPDGKYIAVFSQRSLFGLDLYLADAATGKVLKTLASSEDDARYDVLSFVDSAGTWSPDSRSFAFTVERGGRDAVAVVDVPSGRMRKVIPFAGVKGVSGLAWSPDGTRIALSGTEDAVRNLYLLDLFTGDVERITEGWHSKIQPAWSPDSSTLAFATDVGAGTDLGALRFRSMNIGMLDLATRQTRIISLKDGAKHINPLFSPDGKNLYFISDPDGYSDLYRYSLDDHRFFRVTRVATGISGLTVLSPCLSMTEESNQIVFTVFSHRKYEVHVLALSDAQGAPISADQGIPVASLPEEIPGASGTPAPTLPRTSLTHYSPAFSLLAVSQVGVGLGVSPYGASIGGAAAFAFADVLGNHEIDAAAQVAGTLDSFGAQVSYVNRSDRITWGLAAAHIPQFNYSAPAPANFPANADAGIQQQVLFQEEADLLAQYPLSTNRRLEAEAGYTRYWWEGTASTYFYQGGLLVQQGQISVPVPPALDLFHVGLAYVGDYSYFGFTSPIRGYRWRFEADPSVGTIFFVTALADLRGYLFLNPMTIAFRALHVGRYLDGADNQSLTQFYLGQPDLVRGYDYASISSIEGAGQSGTIPQLARLFGSKIAVFNAELRIAVLGTEQLGLLRFPWLPTELVGFFDGGVAWTQTERPVFEISSDQTQRIPVFSAGAAVRVNILGAFVIQVYWAWPFERQNIGGSWGFVLESGW